MLKYFKFPVKLLFYLIVFVFGNNCFAINPREKLEGIFQTIITISENRGDSLFGTKLKNVENRLVSLELYYENSQLDKSYWICRVWLNSELYKLLEQNMDVGLNKDSICQSLKYYVKSLQSKNKTEEDFELLNLYSWELNINFQKINTWAQTEAGLVNCGCHYIGKAIPAELKPLKRLFGDAYKHNDPTSIKIKPKRLEKLEADFKELTNLRDRFPTVYGSIKGLIFDAKFYYMNQKWSVSDRREFIKENRGKSVKDCTSAWQGYSDAYSEINSKPCEISLAEKSIFSNVIFSKKALKSDSVFNWLNQKVLQTEACRYRKDTCMYKNQSYAENACKDCKDSEYRHSEEICTFCGCTDTMFKEGKEFVEKYPLEEQRISKNSECKTKRKGCLNKCADNYCKECDIDDPSLCIGDNLCGCLDTNAINYALSSFNKNHDYYKKYFDPRVKVHDSTYCIYKGVTDPCVKKYYHPKAKEASNVDFKVCGCTDSAAVNFKPEATHNDGSCLFEKGPAPLDSLKINLISYLKTENYDTVLIQIVDKFLNFAKCSSSDNCLQVSFDDPNGKAMLIGQGVYELGVYKVEFMERLAVALTHYFSHTNMLRNKMRKSTVRVVGEADSNPIRNDGILYRGFGDISINYRNIPNSVTINNGRDLISLPLDKDRNHIDIKQNEIIGSNKELAFLRAYGVANEFKELWSGEDQLLIGAKANNDRAPNPEGYKFRKVSFVIECPDFFSPVKVRKNQNFSPEGKPTDNTKAGKMPKTIKCMCENN